MKVPKTFRLDADLLERAKARGINLVSLIHLAIRRELKINKCPACGRELGGSK